MVGGRWSVGIKLDKEILKMGVGFKNLRVYKLAYELAMEIFELSKSFPKEETYSLTDQIRRSSRAVCSNLAEGYRKRRYESALG